jgi:predicted phosphoribosyltransferase
MTVPYRDRTEAGRILAKQLAVFAHEPKLLVLALPRGGVPVAYEIARALDAPLDVFLVRKLGVPGREELAMGAIATGGVRFLNESVVGKLGILAEIIEDVTAIEWNELHDRERAYRGDRAALDVRDRAVILVDDGLATGATMQSAVAALRRHCPLRLVVAVPVATRGSLEALESEMVEVVCPLVPASLGSIGAWYKDFSQTTDEQVRDLLARANEAPARGPSSAAPSD